MVNNIKLTLQQETEKLLTQLSIKRFDQLRHTRRMTVLSYLDSHAEGVNPSQMAEDLNIARPHLTRVINHMESSSLLERRLSSSDKRRLELFITENGRQELQKLREADHARSAVLYEFLGEEDVTKAIYVLQRLNTFIKEEINTVKDSVHPYEEHRQNEGDE